MKRITLAGLALLTACTTATSLVPTPAPTLTLTATVLITRTAPTPAPTAPPTPHTTPEPYRVIECGYADIAGYEDNLVLFESGEGFAGWDSLENVIEEMTDSHVMYCNQGSKLKSLSFKEHPAACGSNFYAAEWKEPVFEDCPEPVAEELPVPSDVTVQDRINYLCGCDGSCDGDFSRGSDLYWLAHWRGDSEERGETPLSDLDPKKLPRLTMDDFTPYGGYCGPDGPMDSDR